MRGDSLSASSGNSHSPGSPPHAWGQRDGVLPLENSLRFTPTCVGTAKALAPRWTRPPVHPHMRGDSDDEMKQLMPLLGSPPHAWGQPILTATSWVSDRFTPTCVGTAWQLKPSCSRRQCRVHPHMRGDSSELEASSVLGGSRRFTPTCVGTAHQHSACKACYLRSRVHPHMRGDSSTMTTTALPSAGSPPHAWGQPGRPPRPRRRRRFTPTCVGTALLRRQLKNGPTKTVHPHMRGDSQEGRYADARAQTPVHPHMRGDSSLLTLRWQLLGQRFTPTCVGTAGYA